MGYAILVLSLGVLVWLVYCALVIRAQLSLRFIEDFHDTSIEENQAEKPLKHQKKISIVIAVRNGEEILNATLNQLCRNGYQNLEIIVVNDRSQDSTSFVIDRFQQQDARVVKVEVTKLPSGWLGKVHAQSIGAERATGEFILFTDADISIDGAILDHSILAFEQESLDHLSILGHVVCNTFFLDLLVSTSRLLFTLSGRPWKEPPNCSAAQVKGMGAYNMVRRSSYIKTAGLQSFKMELADDVALAQMMRKAGGLSQFFGVRGKGLSFVWYNDAFEMMRGLEKNSVGGFTNYKLSLLGLNVAATFTAGLFPLLFIDQVGAPIGSFLYLIYGASLATLALTLRRRAHTQLLCLVLHPLGLFLLGCILLRAYALCSFRGGIYWGGRFYKLEDLKAGNQVKLGW